MLKEKKLSPGRKQYLDFKNRYPDALLLFRIGDFYETFDEDARRMSSILNIALTSRDVGDEHKSPLAGIPYHALNSYLGKLIKAGVKVAIAEQEAPTDNRKGIMDRRVVRVISAGTIIEDTFLDPKTNNYLVTAISDGSMVGFVYADISTDKFAISYFETSRLINEIERITPKEMIVNDKIFELIDKEALTFHQIDSTENELSDYDFKELLSKHFGNIYNSTPNILNEPLVKAAISQILTFLKNAYPIDDIHFSNLYEYCVSNYMQLDKQAIKNFELVAPNENSIQSNLSIFGILNQTLTPMGSRLLKEKILTPMLNAEEINGQLTLVEQIASNHQTREALRTELKGITDIERCISRIKAFKATPRDIISLHKSLQRLPTFNRIISDELKGYDKFDECRAVCQSVNVTLNDDPQGEVGGGGIVKVGFNKELDLQRSLSQNVRKTIIEIEAKYQADSGVRNLKIAYNKVFGYFIQISKSNYNIELPNYFMERQTLVTAKRYVTEELQLLENRINNSTNMVSSIEKNIFNELCQKISAQSDILYRIAAQLAKVDMLCSLAHTAVVKKWVRPTVDHSDNIDIEDGMHPLIEASLQLEKCVPNPVKLSSSKAQLAIVSGPNMSGKSSYIRMVGTLVLLTQIGSFIPVKRAKIGVVDRIFIRSGLSDDITAGRSTFMTEMVETTSILNQATSKSLIILDEIGRGTSTYDGLAIAQATAEYIHNSPELGCKTLFATHFHEMTELATVLPRVVNLSVMVREQDSKVYFLHRIVEGKSDRSYGVYVARLAGLPKNLTQRAQIILHALQVNNKTITNSDLQLDFFSSAEENENFKTQQKIHSELVKSIQNLDIDNLTPIQALNLLLDLKQTVKNSAEK